ncbi:hypothetical protein [uncultured Microbulbifer sp.]|uniref:hypothetical protein n=1 Tax=uncultured Microbulbifer sp. TaxID=348147 RepID=UPI0026054B15|nr:hypothetical protein [uncultured Microbulbifer sp.]
MAGMSFHGPGLDPARFALHSFLLLALHLFPGALSFAAQATTEPAAAMAREQIAPSTRINSPSEPTPNDKVDAAVYERIHNAELVARVKITGVHRMVDRALSEPGMVAILGYVYSGVTQEVWKGVPSKLVAFHLALGDCDRKLQRGGQYVIFAQTDPQGRLQLSGCEAAVEEADATGLLAQLERYYHG